jgi:deoxyribonuclease-4
MIKFGPAGLGGVNEAVNNLNKYSKAGIKACEIAFTYGIYIKPENAKEIKESAERNNIKLSIHAQYWINLNSEERKKVEESKKRIIECCRIGELLGAYCVVFHPGYYGKLEKEETYNNIKKEILEIQSEIKKNKWKIKIAPETTGKINVFGSVEEIKKLVADTGCFFCVDFAHVYARNNGDITYKEIYEKFKEFPKIHTHFSGIEYGSKGEKKHKLTSDEELKKLIAVLPKNKEIIMINESPNPVGDSIKSIKIFEKN